MNSISNKMILGLVLIGCILFFTACSNDVANNAESANELTNEEQVTNNDNVITSEESNSIKEADIPKSEFSRSKIVVTTSISRNSLDIQSSISKSSMDISSGLQKEVIETLTEFNAVDTEDGAMLTLPENILFDFDSDTLRPEASEAIDKLVQVIETTDDTVTIIGHTDNRGADDYNKKLSKNRAKAVLEALIDSGVNKDRLQAEGKGASEPVAENTNSDGSDNPDGRQKNRRVEVIVHGFEG